jgi:hypothetical protein
MLSNKCLLRSRGGRDNIGYGEKKQCDIERERERIIITNADREINVCSRGRRRIYGTYI